MDQRNLRPSPGRNTGIAVRGDAVRGGNAMKRSGDLVIARDRVIGGAACLCHPERARVERSETSESRRSPRMQRPEIAASGNSHDSDAILFFRNAWSIILAAIREIFDESAYDRFLRRTRSLRSCKSYLEFINEHKTANKHRCC